MERQQALLGFLRAELKTGLTLMQSALIAKDDDLLNDYARSKKEAARAADNVRHFLNQVEDGNARAEIDKQLAELDRLLSE